MSDRTATVIAASVRVLRSSVSSFARIRRATPAVLGFGLLSFQAVLPWVAPTYLTQDGPSHLYTARVAGDLVLARLLHAASPYSAVYRIHPAQLTNWGTTLLYNFIALAGGTEHADQVMSTFCVIAAFFSFSYLLRSLSPQWSPWSPVSCFLLNSWFLWIGFFNFYLGMALCCVAAGFSIRHSRSMTLSRALRLAALLLAVYIFHALAAVLAMAFVAVTCLWVHVIAPAGLDRPRVPLGPALRRALPSFAWVTVALLPVAVPLGLFLASASGRTQSGPEAMQAWEAFPMHAFASSATRAGRQEILSYALLVGMCVAAAAMRRRDWAHPRGAVLVLSAAIFAGYLFVPKEGFGGSEIKIRLAWAVYVFGCLAMLSLRYIRPAHAPLSLCVSAFLLANLLSAMDSNVQNAGEAIEDYAGALDAIPAGATFVRLYFPTERTRVRYGFDLVAFDPLLHADAWMAARKKCLDLGDYQAIVGTFPVRYQRVVGQRLQDELMDLEGSGRNGPVALRALLADFPRPIEYVVLVGDPAASDRRIELTQTMADLESAMALVATDPARSFVRVYRRRR